MHTSTLRRAATTAAVLILAGGALAACGNDDASSSESDHNDADVTFATEMIPHHEQAVRMADMADGMDLDPEVQQLADDIKSAQQPEIDTMSSWLEDWGEDVPDSFMGGMDHDTMEGMDDDGMPGMMGDDDFTRLDNARGPAFEAMWLQMMIEHHEGAIEMAKTEQQDGEYGPATALARNIETSQTAEIEQMKEMLDES